MTCDLCWLAGLLSLGRALGILVVVGFFCASQLQPPATLPSHSPARKFRPLHARLMPPAPQAYHPIALLFASQRCPHSPTPAHTRPHPASVPDSSALSPEKETIFPFLPRTRGCGPPPNTCSSTSLCRETGRPPCASCCPWLTARGKGWGAVQCGVARCGACGRAVGRHWEWPGARQQPGLSARIWRGARIF